MIAYTLSWDLGNPPRWLMKTYSVPLGLWSPREKIGEGNGNPLRYSCLGNPMDGGACWATVHGVKKSQTWLSDFTFTFHFHALEKEMATHSSVLAWRIPGTGEPGGLRSMGLHRVGHGWSDAAAAAVAGTTFSSSLCDHSRGPHMHVDKMRWIHWRDIASSRTRWRKAPNI